MNTENTQATIQSDLDAIESIFIELEEEMGPIGLDDDDMESASGEYDQLEAAIAGTEFAGGPDQSANQINFLQMADGETIGGTEQEFSFGGIGDILGGAADAARKLAEKAARALAKRVAKEALGIVVKLVKRSTRFVPCVPAVALAVASFKVGKYGTALRQANAARRCIQSKI